MSNQISFDQEMLFSVGAVEEQLERIFHDPLFTESKILRRFLSFIVQETIEGRSHCLKEYTIALKVLEKPASFNPQENGIVRIHAGRLRRTLEKYYEALGVNDQIIISIPKGKYVPVFNSRPSGISTDAKDDAYHDFLPLAGHSKITSIAVMPLICIEGDNTLKSFADGLCMQIGSSVTQYCGIPVIAYQAVKYQADAHPDYREIGALLGFSHVITGGSQLLRNTLRVNIQLVECSSCRLVWSALYENCITDSNQFRVQDEICQLITRKIEDWKEVKEILKQTPVGSIAL